MKYFPVYKCALCGTLLRYGNATEIPYEELPKVLGDVIANQQFAGNPYLYQAPHAHPAPMPGRQRRASVLCGV